jgi:hypothetical protein
VWNDLQAVRHVFIIFASLGKTAIYFRSVWWRSMHSHAPAITDELWISLMLSFPGVYIAERN